MTRGELVLELMKVIYPAGRGCRKAQPYAICPEATHDREVRRGRIQQLNVTRAWAGTQTVSVLPSCRGRVISDLLGQRPVKGETGQVVVITRPFNRETEGAGV